MDSCFLHTFINYRVLLIPNEIDRKVKRLQFEAGDDVPVKERTFYLKKRRENTNFVGLILSDYKACYLGLSEMISFHLSTRLLYQNMEFY